MSLLLTSIPLTQHSDRLGIVVDTIVFHWTAGQGSAETAARYFDTEHDFDGVVRKPNSSYHYTIGRDGQIVQMVDLSRASWHAGDGDGKFWDKLELSSPSVPAKEKKKLANYRSVSISMCNRGPLAVSKGGKAAKHSNPGITWKSYEPYTREQEHALQALLAELQTRLPALKFMCGHSDFTRGKGDPGPLFPWALVPLKRRARDWRSKARVWVVS